ncbi:hypothetical protein AwDysgo_01180 [Bacteroidales bacterium]|nr:hypothetical protein AwDysgo_01180 [Bacteroidales bacterium]
MEILKIIPNKNFCLIEETEDTLLFRNNVTEALVSMSTIERDIIMYYVKIASIDKTVDAFKASYELDATVVDQLISKAIDLKLIVEPDYNEASVQRKKRIRNLFVTNKIQYVLARLIFFINSLLHINIVPIFMGDMRFYKLFSIDLNNSMIKKMFVNVKFQAILMVLFGILFLCQTLFFVINDNSLVFSGFAHSSAGSMGSFAIFVFMILIALFFHELAHYFVYKRYGGSSDEIGFGLMYFVFPVMYTNIINVHFWTSKWKKIRLSLAGIFFDVYMLLSITNILSINLEASVFTLCISYLYFYYVVQIAMNLNFLIPGTDGYYAFTDFFNLDRLFGGSYDEFKKLQKNIKSLNFKNCDLNVWKVLYFALCCCSITIYWLFFITFVSYPIWQRII